MWQDYIARRPMEVETFLGSPIRLAQQTGVKLPRIETLYAVLHNLNTVNQSRPKGDPMVRPAPGSPTNAPSPLPRLSSQPNGRPMPNGNGMPRPRPRGSSQLGPPPGMRRPPPNMNGGPPNGYGRPRERAHTERWRRNARPRRSAQALSYSVKKIIVSCTSVFTLPKVV